MQERWRRGATGWALVFTVALGCRDQTAGGPPPRLPPLVIAAEVVVRDLPVEALGPVDLKPLADVDVGAKTLGYLDAVFVDRGDRVKRGQVLALVRPSDLPDQLSVARGQLASAQASATLARTNLERARALAPQAVVSMQELQQAQAQLATAEATEEAARAQIAALGVRLGETRIVSPLDGVVLSRRLDPGALVGPPGGGTILTVARVDVLRASLDVNEREAGKLTLGLAARVELDALPGQSFAGKVTRLAPAFDLATRTLQAEIQLANARGELRPGMYGHGAVQLGVHAHAVVVPVGAVQVSDRKHHVFLLDGETVHRREVTLGVDAGEEVEVATGLKPGDRIVTAGIDNLADGMKVRVPGPAGGAPTPGAGSATAPSSTPASTPGR